MKNIAIICFAISLSALVQLNFARKVGRPGDGRLFPGRIVKTSSGRMFLDLNQWRKKSPKLSVQSETESEAEMESETESEAETEADAEAETEAETESAAEIESAAETESGVGYESGKWKVKPSKWAEKTETREEKSQPKIGAGYIKTVSFGGFGVDKTRFSRGF